MKTLWCFNGLIGFGIFVTMFLFRLTSGTNSLAFPIFLTLVIFLLLALYLTLLEGNTLGSLAAAFASAGIWILIHDVFPICNLMIPFFLVIIFSVAKKMVDNEIKPLSIFLSEVIFGLTISCLVYGIWALEYYAPWVDADTLFYFASQRIH